MSCSNESARRRKKHRCPADQFSLFLLTSGSSADWRVSDAHSVQGTLTVTFIDVGQGDATLVTQGKHALLIDGGDIGQGPLIIRTLKQLRIDHLDAIIATHPHADHIGGLAAVMEEFPVDQIIMPRVSHTTALYEELLLTIRKHQLRIIAARPGLRYQLGQARLEILGPEETDPDDLKTAASSAGSLLAGQRFSQPATRDSLLKRASWSARQRSGPIF
jgi:beta-lactamase superfamily II metal-dependent hydrolase